jgi:CO/xanthine dehydrogenase Mo-binding subunit
VLHVDAATLSVDDGTISSPDSNERTDYWTLAGSRPFGVDISEMPKLKDPEDYRLVGGRVQRLDLPAKVSGRAAFVHDLALPDMRHGRLVKPPQPHARLIEAPGALDLPNVQVVRDGTFLGIVADREDVAERAAAALAARCRWHTVPLEPRPDGMSEYLRAHVSRRLPVVDGTPLDEPVTFAEMAPTAVIRLSATYTRPYQMHASLGPSCAVAQLADGVLTVHSHSQGVELLKLALADVLGLEPTRVHVIHSEGAGCYGHNGADDVALDAALLARAVAPAPVSVKWSRADEHGFEPYAPAAVQDLTAGLDGDGRIVHWRHEAISFSHVGRPRPQPGYTNLQSAWWLEEPKQPAPRTPALLPEVGIHRNLQPIYDLPGPELVKSFVPPGPLRTSSVRSLGAFANVFAIESFMDELAHAAGRDPLAFRLSHLSEPRARALLEALGERAPDRSQGTGRGRGIAMARYKNRQTWCAVMVDVTVTDAAEVRLERALIVADAGLVIDPDGLTNQLEGGFVQAASWSLKEAVTWDHEGVTSRDWETYPILRFSEVPEIETHLMDRRNERALGAGEASTGPTPAAIANAIFDATGIRVRDIPFTPDRVRAAAAH